MAGFVGARAALARRELGHDLAVAGQPHQRHRPHSRRAQLGVVAQDDLDQVGVEAGDGRPDQVQGEGGHLDVLAVVAGRVERDEGVAAAHVAEGGGQAGPGDALDAGCLYRAFAVAEAAARTGRRERPCDAETQDPRPKPAPIRQCSEPETPEEAELHDRLQAQGLRRRAGQ
ncbi:hypothetical protein ACIBIZ_46025 [Nonomuraea spiralis]|uniref:hypothetical protein n=1 Tax=Nonomuraea spiralis TaxID=46182 RepID=UPI0037B86311